MWRSLPFLLMLPALALADAPPPDTRGPCVGKDAGDACYATDCRCVASDASRFCPSSAPCLECQSPTTWECGPTNYHPQDSGGCTTASITASLLGLGLLFHVWRSARRAR